MWVIFTSILWMSLGYLLSTQKLPQILSQSLYWIGIPLQILALARRSDFSQPLWLPIMITILALLLGTWLALLSLEALRWLAVYNYNLAKLHPLLQSSGSGYHATINLPLSNIIPQDRPSQGSFILASMNLSHYCRNH
jgi:malate permease and related proteins